MITIKNTRNYHSIFVTFAFVLISSSSFAEGELHELQISETELFLNNIKDVPNFLIIAGDRHYKYHSVINSENFPQLSHIHEFGPGAASGPPHATGGGGIPSSDLAIRIFQDGLEGTEASAGYLRVEVKENSFASTLEFSFIQVTEAVSNRVIHYASFSVFNQDMQFIPFAISN